MSARHTRSSGFPKTGRIPLRWRGLRWAALVAACVFGALLLTPLPAGLESPPVESVEFVDRDGRPLRIMLAEDERFAREITLGDVSPHVVAATLSAEDKRFRMHPGVDPLAVARALKDAGRTSGASTITQQLVKLSAPPARRTLGRKLVEMWQALRVERAWSKDEILAAYLNRLDYGNLNVGIATASRAYFGKPAADLSAAEAAFLAALPKAPGRLDPHANFEGATARQRWVLARMAANGFLDPASLQRAKDEPIRLRAPGHDFAAPHFVDLLLRRKGAVPAGGGLVETTLDLELNRFVTSVLEENLRALADRNATGGAVVAIENPTGDVLALACVGTGEVNGAWRPRSPGSAMKPFTYALALAAGSEPATVIPDVPTRFATPTGIYAPNNYNYRFYGPVSLRFALANSLNVGAIRALELGGGPGALHRTMKDLGITTLGHPPEHYGLGLTLGNGEVRLLELASAYAALGRLGVHRPFRLLEGGGSAQGHRVFDAATCYLVLDMLSDNPARSASFGSDSYLAFEFPVACKTGTSSDYRDNWTMATTPAFTVGVWVGNANGSSMQNVTGVDGAAPVMHAVVEHLAGRYGTGWFERPAPVTEHRIDPLTGRRSEAGQLEKFARPPAPPLPGDYDPGGRVRLPAAYAEWVAGPQNRLGSLVVAADDAQPLAIVEPVPGTIFYLDGDLPAASQTVPLRARGGTEIAWSSTTLPLHGGRAQIAEGRHTIVARDAASGMEAETWIEVRAW